MGLKHPTQLCNQLSHVTPPLPRPAQSWLSPGWGEEAVLPGKCAAAGALRGGGADATHGAGRVFQEAAGSADCRAAGRDPGRAAWAGT